MLQRGFNNYSICITNENMLQQNNVILLHRKVSESEEVTTKR